MWRRVLWAKILETKIGGVSMAWLAVDKDGTEVLHDLEPKRGKYIFFTPYDKDYFYPRFAKLPKGSIKKLIGRELSWNDEPVELK